jgi:hypothetical protein
MTKKGKVLFIETMRQTGEQVLIKPAKLPFPGGKQNGPLV